MSVQSTEIGIAWIILGLFAFLRGGPSLLVVLIIASIFQSTMVFRIEYRNYIVPIVPYYWISLLIALRLIILAIKKRLINLLPPLPSLKLAGMSFLFFNIYGTLSILLLPYIFAGKPVYDPRGGIDTQYLNLTPLRVSVSMIGQAVYLWINTLVLIFAVIYGKQESMLEKLSRYLIWSGMLVVVLSTLQFLAWTFGVPFPYEFFNNVEGWDLAYMQYLGDVKRISGTFTEPSNLAAFLLGYVAFLLRLWASRRGRRLGALLLLSFAALLLTTSTTAYVGLTLFFIIWTATGLITASINSTAHREKVRALGVFFSVLAIGIIASLLLEPANQVVRAALIEKSLSGSFVHRIAADRRALEIVLETAGFGVGLGGNRPSSFLMWLLSNVGIAGTTSFALGILFTLRAAGVGCRGVKAATSRCLLVSAAVWGLVGYLLAKIISQPDLSFPTLWVWLMFLVVAAVGRMGGRTDPYVSSDS